LVVFFFIIFFFFAVSFSLLYVNFFFFFFFFFNDTATTEIYTLSLHDALPIYAGCGPGRVGGANDRCDPARSEEHTSELQSRSDLVCRLLLEKKKKKLQHLSNRRTLTIATNGVKPNHYY